LLIEERKERKERKKRKKERKAGELELERRVRPD